MTTLVLAAIVCLAFVTEAALGFGATVVTVTLGAFIAPLDVLLPAFVPLNLLLSGYLLARHGRHVERRLLVRRIVPLMALGLPAGLWLFHGGSEALLRTAFGVFVVVLSAAELLAGRGAAPRRPLAVGWQAVLLALAGVVHGAWATGGPLVVYVAGRELADKRVFRATLSALWLVMNAVLVVGYLVGGDLDAESLRLSGVLLAPLVLGIAAGEWVHGRVDAALFRRLVFGLLLAAGAALALRG